MNTNKTLTTTNPNEPANAVTRTAQEILAALDAAAAARASRRGC